jgi:hypothetical protein
LLAQLRAIKSGAIPIKREFGICVNSGSWAECYQLIEDMGLEPGFPIQGGSREYYRARKRLTLWSKRSAYGRARWALLDQMIAFLEKREC